MQLAYQCIQHSPLSRLGRSSPLNLDLLIIDVSPYRLSMQLG